MHRMGFKIKVRSKVKIQVAINVTGILKERIM